MRTFVLLFFILEDNTLVKKDICNKMRSKCLKIGISKNIYMAKITIIRGENKQHKLKT